MTNGAKAPPEALEAAMKRGVGAKGKKAPKK
jgi:hypothetical protein